MKRINRAVSLTDNLISKMQPVKTGTVSGPEAKP